MTGTADGRPGGARLRAFADTGTNLDARVIESYGTGPYPAAGRRPSPGTRPYRAAGTVRRASTARTPDTRATATTTTAGYGPAQGFDQRVRAGGYAPGNDSYDDYADPYQDRYGDDGTAPPSLKPGKGQARQEARARRARPAPAADRRSRGCRGVVLGAAAYTFVFKPKPSTVTPTSAAPLPSAGSSSAATAACVKQFGQYCHIELRTDDPAPLTLAELFPPAFVNETDHGSFTRAGAKLDTTCSNAVIGQDLIGALQNGKCTQVLRASYFSGDGKMMGTIGVANLSTTNEAHHAGKLVGTNDFVDPLTTTKGVTSKLGKGTGVVEAEYKGHYLIMTWAEFTWTNAPANKAQDQQLEAFEKDLVAGTANISLSQRMVNGAPPTAAG